MYAVEGFLEINEIYHYLYLPRHYLLDDLPECENLVVTWPSWSESYLFLPHLPICPSQVCSQCTVMGHAQHKCIQVSVEISRSLSITVRFPNIYTRCLWIQQQSILSWSLPLRKILVAMWLV